MSYELLVFLAGLATGAALTLAGLFIRIGGDSWES